MAVRSKKVTDLRVGDRLPAVRTVVATTHTADEVVVVTDDGAETTYARAGDPAVDVEEA